jgi:flagellar hook-length control protein FliK
MMVQGVFSTGSTTAMANKFSAADSSTDTDFSATLKSASMNRDESGDNGKAVACGQSGDTSMKTEGVDLDNAETADTSNDMDAASKLGQMAAYMMNAAQQIINEPKPKDAAAYMEALMGKDTDVATSDELLNIGAGMQETESAGQGLPQTGDLLALSQTDDSRMALLNAQDNGDKGNNKAYLINSQASDGLNAAKTQDMNNNQAMTQDNGSNDLLQQDAEASAFTGKTGASLSGKGQAFDSALTELKTSALGDQSSDLKETGSAQAFYAQSLQSQNSAARSAQDVQETVPIHKVSSLDETIAKAMNTGQNDIVLRIDPPDLGSLHIRLSLDNGVLKADVRVDSSVVKDQFLAAVPQIKSALENTGIKTGNFNVDVRDDQENRGQSGNNNANQRQRRDGEAKNAFSDFFA